MPESLRLYLLCKAMKWTHLPVAGGIYDQHPKLLDDFLVIMEIDGKVQEDKHREMERKQQQQQRGAGGSRRPPQRRGRRR
jgi:hypothetical protein